MLAILMLAGTSVGVEPRQQFINATVTSISTDGVENSQIYSQTVMVYPKNAPTLKITMSTDSRKYVNGDRIFAHINAQFMNKTDIGEIIVTLPDGTEVINTTELPKHPVSGASKYGADWDVAAGWGNATPDTPI